MTDGLASVSAADVGRTEIGRRHPADGGRDTSASSVRIGLVTPGGYEARRRKPLPPALDLLEAAAMLGIGRTAAYKLVQQGRWPTPVIRLGRLIKVPTRPLLELLGYDCNPRT